MARRGPLANDRLEIVADKKVKPRLKTNYTDGTTHILLSYSEFIEKLVALIPPPKAHLVRWSGVVAPNSGNFESGAKQELLIYPKLPFSKLGIPGFQVGIGAAFGLTKATERQLYTGALEYEFY